MVARDVASTVFMRYASGTLEAKTAKRQGTKTCPPPMPSIPDKTPANRPTDKKIAISI
jgi:hypothetical protein